MADDMEFSASSAGSAHSSRDKAFEIFVKRTITSIQKEAWGRSKEVKEIREACQSFLNTLDQNGCTEATLKEVLYPLQLACSSNMVKVVELALGCLHKLVAHAWLHGESTASGTMDMLSAHGSLDDDDTVANVIKMVIKCGETTNEALQLSVVRALLTFTTAEHFIAHGECLLAAVRAVFQLALGSENPVNKRTACNALLQMLNTICKRVTSIQPRMTGSECSSRTTSDAYEIFRSASGVNFANMSPKSQRGSGTGVSGLGFLSPTAAGGTSSNNSSFHGALSHALSGSGYLATAAGQQELLQHEIEAAAVAAGSGSSGRAAQFAQLAEEKDLQGLEAALGAAAGQEGEEDEDSGEDAEFTASVVAAAEGSGSLSAATPGTPRTQSNAAPTFEAAADSGAADAVNGQEQGNGAAAAGTATVGAPIQQQASVGASHTFESRGSWHSWQQQQGLPPTPRAPQTPSRHGKHSRLTVQDKDVLLVLTAFCKLASREVPGNSADSIMAQGKLLALEMLAKVLSNSFHNWEHVPENFCKQLRQPLCLALLRNCATSDPVAYALALRLLMALLCLPRLRLGLRAELGAFYPLLVLRCLEQPGAEQGNVVAALGALQSLLSEPQLLVDLFVNFDCDLQASNLYERTVQALSRLAHAPESDADAAKSEKRTPDAAATAAGIRKEALACCLQVIAALESWSRPIKEAALRAAETDAAPGNGQSGFSSLPAMNRDASQGSLASLSHSSSKNALNKAGSTAAAAAAELSEAERLAATKSTKELMGKGINLFNTKGALKGVDFLMSNGLLESRPEAVAAFLRAQHDQLDKVQLGELLGHHEDFAVAVMHNWIDAEPSMAGQAIDQSLRRMLGGFRLPGEAQKIDRIMEKFAERYCKDNPGRFGNADAAYVLSFAIIMLNTDAHNPLAERRLGKADFVAMNHRQTEDGIMAPVLPVAQLEEIFDRVVKDEILVRGESVNRDFMNSRTSTRNRLAAAMGWTSLLQPFRALAGTGITKGGKDNALAHRRYLQEMAEREVVRAAASGNIWCSASHPEHVRPMLQVGGPMLLQALSVRLASAPDVAATAPVLSGLLQLAKLSGLLGLDHQCEQCVSVLAAHCGVFNPAPAGSLEEKKHLAALQALLGLTAGPEAGFLGSSWVIVLRCVSALDALKHELTRPVAVPAAAPAKEASSGNAFSRMFANMFGSSSGGAAAASTAASPSASVGGVASSHGRVSLPENDDDDLRDSLDGSKRPTPAIRDAPGAGLVQWAESAAGAVELERPYARSATLDGDAVVVFMRALCAVSQEELDAGSSSTSTAGAAAGPTLSSSAASSGVVGPRLFSLQKVVECAYANMSRIRLVWSKLWAVIAAQLVGASCHPHRRVALYAVDSLRQLVAKLLARSELEHFTHQEEALRPFVAVLRQCDEACVRELAVQCVMQAVSSHPQGLGSGWRMVILGLRLGAADNSPAVMAQTQEALQVVVDTLYTGGTLGGVSNSAPAGGHTFLRETVQAIVAGIRNPAHLELSVSAVQLLGRCGQQLADYEDMGGKDEAAPGAGAAPPGGVDLDGDYGWGLLLRTLADVLQHDRRPQLVDAALAMLFNLLNSFSQRWDAAAWRVLVHRVLKVMLALPPALQATLSGSAGGDAVPAMQRGSAASSFSGFPSLSQGQGRGSMGSPGGMGGGAGGAVPAGLSAPEQRALMTNLLQRMDRYYPMLCEQAVAIRPEYKIDLIQQLAAVAVSWYQCTSMYLSTAGIKALMRLADTIAQISSGSGEHEQRCSCGWLLIIEPIEAAVQADMDVIITLARRQLAEQAADQLQQQQQQQQVLSKGPAAALRHAAGSSGSPSGSPRAGAAVAAGGAFSSSSSSSMYGSPLGPKGGAAARQAVAAAAEKQMLAAQLRTRTQQLVLLQRALATVHRNWKDSMTWDEQMQWLEVLALGVHAAIAFNADLAGSKVLQQQQPQQRRGSIAGDSSSNAAAAAYIIQQKQVSNKPPQQQQQQRQSLECVPEGSAEHALRLETGFLSDTISLASAVSRNNSLSMSGLVGFGSYVHPVVPSSGGSNGDGGRVGSHDGVAGVVAPIAGALAANEEGSNSDEAAAAGTEEAAPAAAAADASTADSTDGSDAAATVAATAAEQGEDVTAGIEQQQEVPAVQQQSEIVPAADAGDVAEAAQQQQQQNVMTAPEEQQQQQLPAIAPIRTSAARLSSEEQQRRSSGSPGSGSSPARRLAAAAAAAQPGSPGRTRMHGVDLPLLMVTSAESVEEVQPALMRLEAEGGLLLLEAFDLSLQSCNQHTAARSQAKQRLLQLVRSIIQSEAACSTVAGTATPAAAAAATDEGVVQPGTPPSSHTMAAGRAGLGGNPSSSSTSGGSSNGSSGDNPLQDALAGVGWQHAARAPLVVAALKVLSSLGGLEYRREVLQLFPALCRLMCSNHLLTRLALQQVFSSREFFELLPAARPVQVVGGQQKEHAQQQQQQQQNSGDLQDVLL